MRQDSIGEQPGSVTDPVGRPRTYIAVPIADEVRRSDEVWEPVGPGLHSPGECNQSPGCASQTGCYARRVEGVHSVLDGEAGDEMAALRSELARTRAELADAQHRLLTLRDHAIGYEAELGQLRNHGGPPLVSREMQAALFVVKVGKALRLNLLLRFGPVKRLARYLLGVYSPRVG